MCMLPGPVGSAWSSGGLRGLLEVGCLLTSKSCSPPCAGSAPAWVMIVLCDAHCRFLRVRTAPRRVVQGPAAGSGSALGRRPLRASHLCPCRTEKGGLPSGPVCPEVDVKGSEGI